MLFQNKNKSFQILYQNNHSITNLSLMGSLNSCSHHHLQEIQLVACVMVLLHKNLLGFKDKKRKKSLDMLNNSHYHHLQCTVILAWRGVLLKMKKDLLTFKDNERECSLDMLNNSHNHHLQCGILVACVRVLLHKNLLGFKDNERECSLDLLNNSHNHHLQCLVLLAWRRLLLIKDLLLIIHWENVRKKKFYQILIA